MVYLIDKAFKMVRANNKLQQKLFESDLPFFIWNLDESGFQASDSVLEVMGEEYRKLEKITVILDYQRRLSELDVQTVMMALLYFFQKERRRVKC